MPKTIKLVTYLVKGFFFKLCFLCREIMLHITHLALLITVVLL